MVSAGSQSSSDRNATSKNPLDGAFAEFANQTLEEWKVPGASIAVIDGQDVYSAGFGFATLPDTPATAETVWYGGSTAKAFTAAMLAHMIESRSHPSLSKGWSTPISSVIPEDFVLTDEWATKHLTLEDAVSHRTGLPRHDLAFFRELDGKKSTIGDLVRNLRNLALTEEPRTKFMYCNFMYVVLSHVIETIMGKGLGDVLKEQIWVPLGMDSTYQDLYEAKKKSESFATGYYWDKEKEEFVTAPDIDLTDISGAGAIFSNVLDYAKWVKCLLDEDTLFSEATHKEIKKPRIMSGLSPLPGMDLETYSLAWQRSVYRGNVIYHHSGGVHAFGSQVYWLPQHKFGVVAHGNTAMTSNAAEDVLIYKLIHDKLEIPQEQRFDPSVHWHGMINMLDGKLDGAIDELFPNRPSPPLPPTLSTSQLVGKYHHAGYKTITLEEAPHPDGSDRKILVANRPEMTWNYRMEFHHASGDYWTVFSKLNGVPNSPLNDYSAAEFRIGADGKPSSVDIHWATHLGPKTFGGTASFARMA